MKHRSQKRKAVADLVSGEFEGSVAKNSLPENLVAGLSKTLSVEPENLDEMKTSLRKEIMSDLAEISAENQKEILKLMAPSNKKRPARLDDQDSDSEPENISVARTATPVKSNASVPKTTPVTSRYRFSQISTDFAETTP